MEINNEFSFPLADLEAESQTEMPRGNQDPGQSEPEVAEVAEPAPEDCEPGCGLCGGCRILKTLQVSLYYPINTPGN